MCCFLHGYISYAIHHCLAIRLSHSLHWTLSFPYVLHALFVLTSLYVHLH